MQLTSRCRVGSASLRSTRPSRSAPLRRPPSALFGGLFGGRRQEDDDAGEEGGGRGGKSDRQLAKEDQWRVQQELLQARRTGSFIRDASDRRRKVAETLAERKNARAAEKAALARGEIPESLSSWKNYKRKEDAAADGRSGFGGIVLPLNPLGNREYDEGERFDLRSPYADGAYVDDDEETAWDSLRNAGRKLLNFKGRAGAEEINAKYGKPIKWVDRNVPKQK
jgi:hypothetical protein